MSGITKEEILAYTDAQNKTAVALEKIVDRLSETVIKQDKILEKMNNGMCSNIAAILVYAEATREDVKFMKVFWSIFTVILAIAFVVVEAVRRFGNGTP